MHLLTLNYIRCFGKCSAEENNLGLIKCESKRIKADPSNISALDNAAVANEVIRGTGLNYIY